MLDIIASPQSWFALISLVLLEIALGVDNLIFLAILVSRLPKAEQKKARILGLSFAGLTRIALLGFLFWLTKLTKPLFYAFGLGISGRDIILILGGVFLLYKSTKEIHELAFKQNLAQSNLPKKPSFWLIIAQIGFLDIIFSLDSVFAAVGMAQHLEVMICAILVAVGVMMFASEWICRVIEAYPSLKILALGFLLIIGVVLIADGLHYEIPKGYVYFAMAFSLLMECINIFSRHNSAKSTKSTSTDSSDSTKSP